MHWIYMALPNGYTMVLQTIFFRFLFIYFHKVKQIGLKSMDFKYFGKNTQINVGGDQIQNRKYLFVQHYI